MYDDFAALIFDMDGTLVDSGKLHEHAWSATLEKYNIPMDRAFMRSLAGVPTKGTLQILLDTHQIVTDTTLDEMNAFKEAYVHQYMHEFVKPTALIAIAQQYHGIKPMAIGTGASTQEAHTILKICGLDHFIQVVVGADQVTRPKPAPDTFLRCAELLGVAAQKCVVFEDSKLGLQAAMEAGMGAVDVLEIHGVVNDYFL